MSSFRFPAFTNYFTLTSFKSLILFLIVDVVGNALDRLKSKVAYFSKSAGYFDIL